MRNFTRSLLAGLIFLGIAVGTWSFVPSVGAQSGTIRVSKVVASGFNRPVAITHAGDGSNRLFVVEQHSGLIRIIKNGSVLPTPFLNIGNLVSKGGEQGLLGLAFHPQYQTNGLFYVYYTDLVGVGNSVVARYRVSANPDVADPASAVQVLYVTQPYANHNGGTIAFGPDGYLYISLGDGGSGGDPQNNAQNINNLLGKILRVDVNNTNTYTIPSTNPFAAIPGSDEIWSYGLRNPWKFSFDRLNGDLYLGDVGQNTYEEIDFQAGGTPGGLNYGWRCLEGYHLFSSAPPCNNPAFLSSLVAPIAEYDHTQGYSVTGGVVYRGKLFPALQGKYFYADFGGSAIWSLKKNTSPPWFGSPVVELRGIGFNISAFGEDELGEVYLADYSGGTIRQLEDPSGPTPYLQESSFKVSTPVANRGESITYTIQIVNRGGVASGVNLSNAVPLFLTIDPTSLSPGANYNPTSRVVTWSGTVNAQEIVSISYNASVDPVAPDGSINNKAVITWASTQVPIAVSLNIPRPVLNTNAQNFYLPGTQPGGLLQPLQTSVDCDNCHTAQIYDRWRGSPMSQAGRDPLMWAAMRVSNSVAPGSGEFCVRCHMPKGWLEGRSQNADGTSLSMDDVRNGVACLACHRMVDSVASAGDEAVGIDALVRSSLQLGGNLPPVGVSGSAMLIIDPNDNRRGPFSLAQSFPYHTAKRTDLLAQTGSAITRSRLCGSCHNLSNPLLSWDAGRNQYWPNPGGQRAASFVSEALFPIERTFDEWALSEFANGGVVDYRFSGSKPGGLVETCQDCHMQRVTGKAADDPFFPVVRDCGTNGCLPQHDLVGANTWLPQLLQMPAWRFGASGEKVYLDDSLAATRSFLRKSAGIDVRIEQPAGNNRRVTVRVTNWTGHKLPTGYPEGRRMWLNLRAFDVNGNLIYESGSYNPASGDLTIDASTKIYEAKLGLTPELASTLGLSAGESFFFSLNNTYIKDNRIPPRGYTVNAFNRPGLRPVGANYANGQNWDETVYQVPAATDRVFVTLYHQTASKEYVQFLAQYGGLDGETLETMWQEVKSPPEIVAVGFWPVYTTYLARVSK